VDFQTGNGSRPRRDVYLYRYATSGTSFRVWLGLLLGPCRGLGREVGAETRGNGGPPASQRYDAEFAGAGGKPLTNAQNATACSALPSGSAKNSSAGNGSMQTKGGGVREGRGRVSAL